MRNLARQRFLILCILWPVFCASAFADSHEDPDERRHVLWLAPQIGYLGTLDEGFSPLPRSAGILGIKFGYDYRGERVVNEFALEAGYGIPRVPPDLSTPLPKEPVEHVLRFNIGNSLLVPVKLDNNIPLTLYFGGAARMDGQVLVHTFRQTFPYAMYFFLDALARVEWPIDERQTLRGGVVLPLLGVSWRPPWAGYLTRTENLVFQEGYLSPLFQHPQFAFWHNRQSITFELRYTFDVYKWMAVWADYEFQFLFDNSARPLSLVEHMVSLGVEFRL